MGNHGKKEKKSAVAVFAAGCFWSKEYFLSRQPGVLSTRVGFTGGQTPEPSYRQVCTKTTGHAEAVEITYDPDQTSFETLARYFFQFHDPTVDRQAGGGQYRSAIFYQNEAQKEMATGLIRELEQAGYRVATSLEPATTFWPAAARHQKYCLSRGLEPRNHFTIRFNRR